MRKILILLTVAFTVTIIFNSCKTTRKITTKKKEINLEQIYDSTYKNRIDYQTIDAKFNVRYKQGSKNIPLKGTLRILKDSIIWISVGPGLGIEAARIMCTRDSVFMLDKLNNSLTKGNYGYIKKMWKVDADYKSLQSILTNQFFIFPGVNNEKSDFVGQFTLKNDTSKLLAYRKTLESVENLITFNKNDFCITDYLINDVPNLRSLIINYTKGEFENVSHFPKTVSVSSTNSGKSMNVVLDYTKLVLNSNPSFSFNIPASYRLIVH